MSHLTPSDLPDELHAGRPVREQVGTKSGLLPGILWNDIRLEPTGRCLQVAGVTVADFRDHRIEAFRTYFDSVAPLEQMTS
jgi:hypothetical protein